VLGLLFGLGTVAKGARSWFDLGFFSFQPSDLVKLALIILLAKYFSRRHIEIANIRHILVSGVYAGIISLFVLIQPDFGSSIILFLIWFGMVLVSGLSKKHVALVFLAGMITFAGLWNFGFQEYQKNRIRNFINPLADIHGSGYNAFQAMVAVGSGQVTGKGIGFGTQSRLKFLPEYQTDFIFAAYAEEWGFIGVLIVFISYITLIWRILLNALRGATNFEILFGCGIAILFLSHFIINVGMNIGLLPVTGIVLPLMSYGGTHMLMEYTALGMVVAMRRYSRVAHKDVTKNEFLGPQ
jgi:rod shape determining protein RodA